MALSPLSSLTGNTRGVSSIGRTYVAPAYGHGEGSEGISSVNLENKTGISNQAVTLPGNRQTVTASKLDLCC